MGSPGEDLNVDFGAAEAHNGVDGGANVFESGGRRGSGGGADAAIKVPFAEALRQRLAALAFHVFAHVVFDGFDNTGVSLRRNAERENFLHVGQR